MIDKRLIIAAAINNVESNFIPIAENIGKLSSQFKDVRCILVESNSRDNTLEVIKQYKHLLNCKLTLLQISGSNPGATRMENISDARNAYLDLIKEQYSDYDLLYMLDFNETNVEPYNMESIMTCFENYDDWDMICANQEKNYYDLYALRHKVWMPFNCWKMIGTRPSFMTEHEAKNIYVRSRFLNIPQTHDNIKVESAFGGSAFAKIKAILNTSYSPYDEEGDVDCEWVAFCKNIDRVYINPRFINMKKLSRHVM